MRRKGDMPFSELMQSLSTFFAAEILRLNSVSLSYQTVLERSIDAPLLDEVLNWVEKKIFEENMDKKAENVENVWAKAEDTEGGGRCITIFLKPLKPTTRLILMN